MTTPTAEDWAILSRFGVTPDNLHVGGYLDLRGTGITALPDGLSVGGSLDLEGTAITALPDNLSVGEWLYLRGTGITALYEDDRGYRLDRAGKRYIAGCRKFTAAEAIAHWGSPEYPTPQRGAAYVAAVKAEEERRKGDQT
jgi:hypothetical protein